MDNFYLKNNKFETGNKPKEEPSSEVIAGPADLETRSQNPGISNEEAEAARAQLAKVQSNESPNENRDGGDRVVSELVGEEGPQILQALHEGRPYDPKTKSSASANDLTKSLGM